MEMQAKAAMLLTHGGLTGPQATAVIEAVSKLPSGGALPDVALLLR
jgi:hypothetical protein